ncbi:RNA polymerase sigma factor [Streptomyces avidinii]|uniref:RNA polymerase sigma-70 factor (ECF subfamily) n=1 Tax=Streptomyces avidinii TaxID=1895 RepID=A0ABS4LHI1_STRAV|nr:sigma-70 family RNA polymerase sigma factor [Streptomyces avidinii]MBP2041562.1 RNA polymerase sigma-70 factor (ECF subfamily) [Streptomyces avidinii]GGZ34135.1 ECF sigma factor FemI [Streptomyces avidinii]
MPANEHSAAPTAPAVGAAALPEPSARDFAERRTHVTTEQAYQEFFEHHDFLRNYLRRQAAEDTLIEDALSQAAARYARFRPERDIDNPRAYLTMTARNALKDLLRVRRRNTEVLIGDDWDVLPQETERSAEDIVVENYLREELLLKIRSLPVRQREAVVLIYINGMSYQEAAQELSIPVPLLRRAHSRALQTLRELFGVPSAKHIET